MTGRDEKTYQEACALWRQVRGDPLPEGADARRLLDLILASAPAAPYERLASPHLRPANIAFPKHAPR